MDKRMRRENLKIEILNTHEEYDRFHQDTELIYVMEGNMEIKIGEYKTYLPHEGIYVADGNKNYSYQASENILFVRLTIPYQMLSYMTQNIDVIFWCDSGREDNKHYDKLRKILKKLLNRYLNVQEKGEDFGFLAFCYQLMDVLTTNFLLRLSDKEQSDDRIHFEERLARINNYINANYNQPISSRDLSEKLFLSQGYLSRFFKKYYGKSFAEYLQGVRLLHAVDDLIYTGTPVTRIAYDNGFANVAAFNKAFKERYGETPSIMRKRLRDEGKKENIIEQDKEITKRLIENLRMNGAEIEEMGETTKVQDSCFVGHSTKFENIWSDTINIGSASELLRSEIREHVLLLADTLNFQYVRFWNIFSKDMLIDLDSRQEAYNFSKLDTILDFLVENGLKPHIEIGMKPKRLYWTVQKAIVEEKARNFYNLKVYEKFLHTMMSHLLRRYRRSELNTWRIELWFNEQEWGKAEEEKRYFEQFNILYKIVKQYSDKLLVGGCGLRPDQIDIEKTGLSFLRQWKKQEYQPDFISMLSYAYERGAVNSDRYSKRSTDSEAIVHSIMKIKLLMEKSGLEDLKLYVTEWNLTVSDRNFINDTCFKGAYILKNILDSYGKADMMSYFLGSDRVSEHYDSDGPLYGGSGLLSKDGILKPAGYAFQFLKWLYPYYVGKGKNYLLTTDQHDSYGIICHNQKDLNYNYYLSNEDEIQKEQIWKYFEDRDVLELSLNLTNVSSGQYQIKTYRINENIGGILKTWGEMDYEIELSRNDIKYLKRICGPNLMINTVEVQNDILPLKINLLANEIRFIRIRKLQ